VTADYGRLPGFIRGMPMNAGKLVFAQVMEFAPWHTFRRLVSRYRGNFNVRPFRCLDQFLCMAFAQLTYRESLRDIEACLVAQPAKLYHLGIRENITRSNLANETRDWRIYCEFAQALIRMARRLYAKEPLEAKGSGSGDTSGTNLFDKCPDQSPGPVESRCGAVALDMAYLFPPLSFGGASIANS